MSDPLSRAAALHPEEHDPLLVAEAVNSLLTLEPGDAIDRVLLAADPSATGGLWVLRTLFDPPPGQALPEPRIGVPSVDPPRDPAALPRFPIVLVCDLPLLAIRGYMLSGLAESLDDHAAWYRTNATMRTAPLHPSTDRAAASEEFERAWRAAYGHDAPFEGFEVVEEQLARL